MSLNEPKLRLLDFQAKARCRGALVDWTMGKSYALWFRARVIRVVEGIAGSGCVGGVGELRNADNLPHSRHRPSGVQWRPLPRSPHEPESHPPGEVAAGGDR